MCSIDEIKYHYIPPMPCRYNFGFEHKKSQKSAAATGCLVDVLGPKILIGASGLAIKGRQFSARRKSLPTLKLHSPIVNQCPIEEKKTSPQQAGYKISLPLDGSSLFYALALALKAHPHTATQLKESEIWDAVPADPVNKQNFQGNGCIEDLLKVCVAGLHLRSLAKVWIEQNRGDFALEAVLLEAVKNHLDTTGQEFQHPKIPSLLASLRRLKYELDLLTYGKPYLNLLETKQGFEKAIQGMAEVDKVQRNFFDEDLGHLSLLVQDAKVELQKRLPRQALSKKESDIQSLNQQIAKLEQEINTYRISEYIEQIGSATFFGGPPQIMAISQLYNVQIDVVNSRGQNRSFNLNSQAMPIVIEQASSNHFNLIATAPA